MCGIAGIVGHPDAAASIARMTRVQEHRGPDGEGILRLGEHAALGHRRLAILDLSEQGAQPMTSQDGRWSVVLNGEIFNYRELRAELAAIPWRSQTDTEVFLEAIAAWGLERTLEKSIGMFAAGVWDHREQTLWIARDRLGEKPLVYLWDGITFAFASEMKALAGLHDARVNPAALDVYLGLGYIPAPLGIFRNTFKLPPGHLGRFRGGSLTVKRWWFPERAAAAYPSDCAAELRGLLYDSVRLRLRADVPIAVALSGGVDSSVIAAELSAQNASPDAFTVAFDGDDTDVHYASTVARHLGIRHEVVRASLDTLNAAEFYDEPFADSSNLGCLALARAVHSHYKVILNGDGGDEAFGGYRHYEHIAAKQLVKSAAAAAGFRDGFSSSTVYVQSKTTFPVKQRQQLLNGHATKGLEDLLTSDPYLRSPRSSTLKQALWNDRHLALANGLTHKMDIALSAFGIEGRAPLLDHRLLEWAQNLDDRLLVRGAEKKVLLRDAFKHALPAAVLRRRKQGFGAPVERLLTGSMREQVRSLLPCPLLEAKPQQALSGQQQWTVFTLAQWAKTWRATW